MDNVPLKGEPDQERIIKHTVSVGDIIKSPLFANLLFKDIIDLDAFCGFEVNPMIITKDWDNSKSIALENMGFMQKKIVLDRDKDKNRVKGHWQPIKISIDADREFVVLYTFRNTKYQKEYTDEDDRSGHYPLGVIMKMLKPDGEWDDFGMEVWFNMESSIAKHSVQEVESTGFMAFNKTRTF